MFVDKSDDFVASRLVAMGREMAEVLFDKWVLPMLGP